MKKLILIILNIILAFSCLMPTWVMANAETPQGTFSLKFALTDDNGQSVVLAEEGDVITVSFTMQRTDTPENYTTNGFQNYIHYDLSFFEFVENSIVCYDTGSATAQKLTNLTHGEIIQCQNMSNSYAADFVFCTFQLKVVGTEGSGRIYNGEVYAFDANFQEVTITTQEMQVIIDTNCLHSNKTKVEATPSTCTEKGWNTYYDCNKCDAIFDESGETLIAEIPYIAEAHSFTESMVADEIGHWYECTHCGETSKYSVHSGGTATCAHKATCDTCEQGYGDLDASNHTGETIVKNKKSASFGGEGYTGDVHCAGCNEVLELGEAIAAVSFDKGTLLILLLLIILILIVLGLAFNG